MSAPLPTATLVMGVSGSGKTTIGALLAGRFGCAFADADDFHPPANIAKMERGVPLDDGDRAPWLAAIAREIERWRAEGTCGVIACSALKRRYRDRLTGGHTDVRLVYLRGEREVLRRRLTARLDHFMPAALLDSQLDTLEEPTLDERPIVVDVTLPPAELVDQIADALTSAQS